MRGVGRLLGVAVLVGACAWTAAPGAGAAARHPALGRADCGDNEDFLKTYDAQGDPAVCFADAGDLAVTLYDVARVYSGNNIGWLSYTDPQGNWHQLNFPARDQSYNLGGRGYTVHQLHIN